MDTTISSSANLPIRQIRDVNLAWVRNDLGDLSSLRDSIEEHGLQLPILLTTSMFVADGARRLVACEQLGKARIPVVVTSDWDLVTKYYARARELAREGWPHLPMQWVDLADLLNGPMKDLYAERYRVLRKEIYDRNVRVRSNGGKTVKEKKHLYTTASAEVLGFREADLRTIRELHTTLRKMRAPGQKGEDPAKVAQRHLWAKMLTEQLRECEENGGERLYAMLARIRMAARGEDPTTVRYARGRRNVGDPTYTERRAAAEEAAAIGRGMDAATMSNVETLLSNLADSMHFYTHVRPAVRVSDAAAAAESMKRSVKKINNLINVIRLYGNSSNPNLEERSQA